MSNTNSSHPTHESVWFILLVTIKIIKTNAQSYLELLELCVTFPFVRSFSITYSSEAKVLYCTIKCMFRSRIAKAIMRFTTNPILQQTPLSLLRYRNTSKCIVVPYRLSKSTIHKTTPNQPEIGNLAQERVYTHIYNYTFTSVHTIWCNTKSCS